MNTREFKIGDRVRLVSSDGSNVQEINLGNIGVVTGIDKFGARSAIEFYNGHLTNILNKRLELVQEETLSFGEALAEVYKGKTVESVGWIDGSVLKLHDGIPVVINKGGEVLFTLEHYVKSFKVKDYVETSRFRIVEQETPQTPKFTVDSFVMNRANDIGKIKEVITGKSDVLYRVSFNGLTSKVVYEDELKEAM